MRARDGSPRLLFLLILFPLGTPHAGAGNALSLDGTGHYVEVPDNSALDIRGSITLELWVYPHVIRQLGMRLIDKTTVGYGDAYILDTYPSNRVRFGIMPGTITTTDALPINQWTHVAAVYDSVSGEQTIYLNGEVKAQATGVSGAISANGLPLRLGANSNLDGEWFDGEMDEVRVWNIARTQAQIQENVRQSLGGSESGLVAYWKFDETAGDTVYDSAGDNQGIIVGGQRTGSTLKFDLMFVDIGATLPSMAAASNVYFVEKLHWGDIDNDGDLDILCGAHVCRNSNGSSFEPEVTVAEDNVVVAIGEADYDNDLDLYVRSPVFRWSKGAVYANANGAFSKTNAAFPDTISAAAVWGDFDNDGDQDLLTAAHYYQATRGGIRAHWNSCAGFTDGELTNTSGFTSVTKGDFDNDGFLDALFAAPEGLASTGILQNDDDSMVGPLSGGLPGIKEQGDVDWGDYDNDGDLDVVIAGADSARDAVPARIFRNDNGSFVDAGIALPAVFTSAVDWGDIDNDGDLDLVMLCYAGLPTDRTVILYNQGNSFTAGTDSLPVGNLPKLAALGDYDNDNDLDLLIAARIEAQTTPRVFRNTCRTMNTPPEKPTGLATAVTDSTMVLSWDRATDKETPQLGLSYNIFIAGSDPGFFFKSPLADTSTGFRLVPEIGNAGQRTTWTFRRWAQDTLPQALTPDHWGVQAIDHSHVGSPFAVSHVDIPITYLEIVNDSVMAPTGLLSWMVVHSGKISGYHVQVDDDSLFGSCEVDDSMSLTLSGNGYFCTRVLNDLQGSDSLVLGTRYYWRMKPYYLSNIPTVFSDPPSRFWYGHVSESSPRASRRLPGSFGFTLHRTHPLAGGTTIRYQLPQETSVTIGVYTSQGRLVSEIVSQRQVAGFHQVHWRPEKSGGGLYYVRMRTDRGFGEIRNLPVSK